MAREVQFRKLEVLITWLDCRRARDKELEKLGWRGNEPPRSAYSGTVVFPVGDSSGWSPDRMDGSELL
jgi:hypothetical protein